MSKSRLISFVLSAAFLLAACLNAQKSPDLRVSIRDLGLGSERVTSIQISLASGAFQSVSNLPVGWYFTIDNDASWQTNMKASIMVGAAAMKSEDLKKIEFVVKKHEFGDLKFRVSGTIVTTLDFSTERKIELKMNDFLVAAAN
jgi:hypothetical protein